MQLARKRSVKAHELQLVSFYSFQPSELSCVPFSGIGSPTLWQVLPDVNTVDL